MDGPHLYNFLLYIANVEIICLCMCARAYTEAGLVAMDARQPQKPLIAL